MTSTREEEDESERHVIVESQDFNNGHSSSSSSSSAERLHELAPLLDLIDLWTEKELSKGFLTIIDSLFSGTPEYRLAQVLLRAEEPLTFKGLAMKSEVSRDLVLRDGRIRRAIERMEKAGLLLNKGREERPQFVINPKSSEARLFRRIFFLSKWNDASLDVSTALGKAKVLLGSSPAIG